MTMKPEVCWQPDSAQSGMGHPARRQRHPQDDDHEYDRRGWGEGGEDLHWYCTGDPAAHVGAKPVWRSYAAELTELLGEGICRVGDYVKRRSGFPLIAVHLAAQ